MLFQLLQMFRGQKWMKRQKHVTSRHQEFIRILHSRRTPIDPAFVESNANAFKAKKLTSTISDSRFPNRKLIAAARQVLHTSLTAMKWLEEPVEMYWARIFMVIYSLSCKFWSIDLAQWCWISYKVNNLSSNDMQWL